ncbi:MAG: hypothetical protein ACJA04_000318 [Cellvibrionaceae bacterium]|jgi:hypothetical protein
MVITIIFQLLLHVTNRGPSSNIYKRARTATQAFGQAKERLSQVCSFSGHHRDLFQQLEWL